MKGKLILEDGSEFAGISIGTDGEKIGEVILNTGVVGYQEMMTDTANAGKILVPTYPLIGNYGIAKKFYQSKKCWIEGLTIKEKSRIYSNWQAETSVDEFLKKEKIVALAEVDTRTLAVKIRDSGEIRGIISTNGKNKSDLLKKLKEQKVKNDFIKKISVKKRTEIKGKKSGAKIGIIDIGILNSFLVQLKILGCNITLLPYNTSGESILKMKFDGVIISSGPEDDVSVPKVVETTKELIGKVPMLGISVGHQIICLAQGGKIKKMKLGHRGVNCPVVSPFSHKGEITTQNHGYVVDEDSIKDMDDIEITLRNVNDNSVEEIESKKLKFISTQYYPVSPGFDEVHPVFKKFLEMIEK